MNEFIIADGLTAFHGGCDEGSDLAPSLADLDPTYRNGRLMARIARCMRGASSPNLVADRNEMSLAREIPSLTQRASA